MPRPKKETTAEQPAKVDPEAIRAMAKAEGRRLRGEETLAILEAGEQFEITARPKQNPKEGDFVLLACINGVKFWAQPGETKSVPIEVARIAWRAGDAVGAAPSGVERNLREVNPPAEIAIHPNKK